LFSVGKDAEGIAPSRISQQRWSVNLLGNADNVIAPEPPGSVTVIAVEVRLIVCEHQSNFVDLNTAFISNAAPIGKT
jgi:hypothetical protein